jgi:hypothetical protein
MTIPNPDHEENSAPGPEGRGVGVAGLNNEMRSKGLLPEETMLHIVRRLLEHEAGDSQCPAALAEASERVCQKLRVHLADVMGTSGFRFLMVRAATTAGGSFKLTINDDGCLKMLDASGLDPSQQAAAQASLANVLELLADYIGQNLVLRFIHQVWPDFLLLPPFSQS